MLRELENAMEEVEAQSSFCGYFYQLSNVLIIMVCGLLSNLQDIKRIHAWSQSKYACEFLKDEFGITQIPCRSHFYNILGCVNYEAFSKCFSTWMADVLSRKQKMQSLPLMGKLFAQHQKGLVMVTLYILLLLLYQTMDLFSLQKNAKLS